MPPLRHALALATLPLSACVSAPRLGAPAPAPAFDAFAFFAGTTEGKGRLRKMLSAPEPVAVHGRGHVEGDTLVLDQTVEQGTRSPKVREWRIRLIAPGHYAGTLSDAKGPVDGVVTGNRLHLAFHAKGGIAIEQWMTLAADGRTARNVLRARKFGVPVATLDEEIRKTGGWSGS